MYTIWPLLIIQLIPLTIYSLCILSNDTQNDILLDKKHGVKMGISNSACDDAKTNLTQDWKFNYEDFTCYTPKLPIEIRDIEPIEKCHKIPSNYYPLHFCMNTKIVYNTTLPTFGDHRPLWPVYGEYLYLPPQRWLHNVEHGAVIMLYHPCAHPYMVKRLQVIVEGCIRKHIISPYRNLSIKRPLALVTWGCSLEMNWVHMTQVVNFIRRTALHGPEGKYSKEGQYKQYLIRHSQVPNGSNYNDSVLCPNF